MPAIRFAALVAAFAAGTYFLDWSMVPVIASVYALLRRQEGATKEAAAAVTTAWLLLLAKQMATPAFGALLNALGSIFPVKGNVLIVVTLAFASMLAASAARLSVGLVGVKDSPA
ncbi:MAG: hypothetical protein IT353_18040 [Gemmatimonadaceae bacterium]|nr:hypothetical protein [Gemmatimonadaceae bacterium]